MKIQKKISDEGYEHFQMAIKALAKEEQQESVLDKIRAEIEQLRLHKAQFLTSDNKVCIDSQDVLNIIDKYKSEVEPQMGGNEE